MTDTNTSFVDLSVDGLRYEQYFDIPSEYTMVCGRAIQ